jgi:hypothetical protein
VATALHLPATLLFDQPNPRVLARHLRSVTVADETGGAPALDALDLLEAALSGLDGDDAQRGRIASRLLALTARWNDQGGGKAAETEGDGDIQDRIDSASADEIFALIDNDLGIS